MARYVVGDVQGCMRSFERLLQHIEFDARRDEMLFAGDLANRGPRSLEVLRWARRHDAACVLGNHELHLLGVKNGWREPEDWDASRALDAAEDGEDLLAWMRRWPLVRSFDRWFVVHAGLLPAWTFEEAERRARAAEDRIRTGEEGFLQALHAAAGDQDSRHAEEVETARVLTRIRGVDARGRMCPAPSGAPEDFPPGVRPWYEPASVRPAGRTVLFGHWASLGVRRLDGAISLDSGCVWGGSLSCLRLEDERVFQVAAEPGEVHEWKHRPAPADRP